LARGRHGFLSGDLRPGRRRGRAPAGICGPQCFLPNLSNEAGQYVAAGAATGQSALRPAVAGLESLAFSRPRDAVAIGKGCERAAILNSR
jgi:hypothetical protein